MRTPPFDLQGLEPRTLFCGLPIAIPAAGPVTGTPNAALVSPSVPPAGSPQVNASFTLSGSYSMTAVPVDVGKNFQFTGGGTAGALGVVTLTGSIGLPGFIANGRARGTLVLSQGGGAMTLALRGPAEPGFGPMPKAMLYTVTAASGSFTTSVASGSVEIVLYKRGHQSHFTFIFHPAVA